MRVLVVEDDPRIAADVSTALNAAGYVTESVANGEEAWFRGDTEDYVAVVLDLGLPGMDGLSVLKRWRQSGRKVPVLVLTARGNWSERVEGIDAGADDYLPKPFRVEELLARLRAIIRRSSGQAGPVLSVGAAMLDPRQMRVAVDGLPIALSVLEYRLVAYLMLHRGRVVPQQELMDHVYGHDSARETNALEVLLGRVRRKLPPSLIETRRGFGYLVAAEDE